MKKSEYLGRLLVVVGITLVVLFGRKVFVEYIEKARESEMTTNIAAVVTSEEAYYQEFKTYTTDLKKAGYVPEGKLRGAIYLTYEETPADIQQLLTEDEKPFVSQDSYRILGVFRDGKTEIILFVKDKDQPIKRIANRLPQNLDSN